jgi:hypothetical protein
VVQRADVVRFVAECDRHRRVEALDEARRVRGGSRREIELAERLYRGRDERHLRRVLKGRGLGQRVAWNCDFQLSVAGTQDRGLAGDKGGDGRSVK